MTSNIGAELLKKQGSLGFAAPKEDESHNETKQRLLESVKKAFKPEFINRIDDIIAIIQTTGAIDYTAQTAQEETDAAKSALKILPDSDYKTALLALADFAVSREF